MIITEAMKILILKRISASGVHLKQIQMRGKIKIGEARKT
jgi:hypothetical protein